MRSSQGAVRQIEKMTQRRHQTGFSFVQLLIVATAILIISAIAIAILLRSKMAGNEAAALGTLRTVNSSCTAYSWKWGTGYPVSLSNLGPSKPATAFAADLVDSSIAGGTKSGYEFTYVSGAPAKGKISTYMINATPVAPGQTGEHYFFTDQSGVIRYSSGGPATVSSPPIS
jgi:type IV pilus assembly protein PilA